MMSGEVKAIVVILAVGFLFGVPVVAASEPGGALNSHIHYTESIGCYLEGGFPRAWLGVYYFEGSFGVGCWPGPFF